MAKAPTTKRRPNDYPVTNFSQLRNEIRYSNFLHKGQFQLICKLNPNKSKGELEIIKPLNPEILKKQGLVFIFVIKGKIYKIGQTTKSIKERVGSFNCGKKRNRKRGTSSTGNYFDLQSLINLNCRVDVYVTFAKRKNYNFFIGSGRDFHPSPAEMKKKIIADFKKNHKILPYSNDLKRR